MLFALGKKGKKGGKIRRVWGHNKKTNGQTIEKQENDEKHGEEYSNDIKTRIKIWTARIKISKESIEAHAHKKLKIKD